MFFKILIISIILVAIIMLALGVKMLFDPKAKFTVHSCEFDDKKEKDGGCSFCELNDKCDVITKSKQE